MKKYPLEFAFQVVSLVVAVIVVHAAYVLVVRPKADLALARLPGCGCGTSANSD